ncbi:MAG: 2-phosphosulfolactate phosphatase [Humibacillus sp.]|nr:2-phosphosulfolactate phosphatase [Humibacillus sp.]MDN5776765.1 2-phosphosulfolactate phosphatase [Humibacillus sp.]
MRPSHSQSRHPVRLEWGAEAALALTRHALEGGASVYAVVVDVLSFSTSVTVAADAGLTVLPYRWGQDGARAFADERSAVLAQPRSHTLDGGISLSPKSIRDTNVTSAIVLPSPNGSTIAEKLAGCGAVVVVAALRNRAAVGRWLARRLIGTHDPPQDGGTVVILVPAGERWPDGSLRPAVEDLWGAGGVAAAVIQQLEGRFDGYPASRLFSPEAATACSAYTAVIGAPDRLTAGLAASASGRELIDSGWPEDVAIAGELDHSRSVPVLTGGAFRPEPSLPDGRPEG